MGLGWGMLQTEQRRHVGVLLKMVKWMLLVVFVMSEIGITCLSETK